MPRAGWQTRDMFNPPPPTPLKAEGFRHNVDCTSNLASQTYDARCLRCAKIRMVVFLRRKTVHNGATLDESLVALEKASDLVSKWSLTKGEVHDFTYQTPQLEQVQKRRRSNDWAAEMDDLG